MDKRTHVTLKDRVQERYQTDFGMNLRAVLDARSIVVATIQIIRDELADRLSAQSLEVLNNIEDKEINKITGKMVSAFGDSGVGLPNLLDMARREIGILVTKRSVPKYSVKYPTGQYTPVEYFDLFYRYNFLLFGIPANNISIIDPNLHSFLKKRDEFYLITDSLKRGTADLRQKVPVHQAS
jgi:hypothetical protein